MNIKVQLKVIFFLQFFIWGSWLITLGSYMMETLKFSGTTVGSVYGTMGIASLFMPGLLGVVADRWIPANRLFMLCHLIGAITLFIAASITSPFMMVAVMLIHCLAFMPTIAISNSISYSCLESKNLDVISQFPSIRIFGTIGFIVAMWLVSFLKLELSNMQLYIAAASSILLSLYSLSLPVSATTKNDSQEKSLVSSLGLDAFVLFKQPRMAIFFIFAVLLGGILQITNTFGNPFLRSFAEIPQYSDSLVVQYPSVLLSISQISEVVFILFVPFFMKRLGIKYVMLISMLAWVLRFGLFAYGDPSPVGFVLLLLSMIVYGCAFDFYNISGSMYVEKSVSPAIRNSAQGLFMIMTNGLGAYLGSTISGIVVDHYTTAGIIDWRTIWLIFAGYSLILAIIFLLIFKNDTSKLTTAKTVS
ncbi:MULTISPECIES: nucleoside permease [unclassified Gilliamella]|uniref:nucleoside permease n=1 Tax=unclassified Gilliamella TaxID=2685620 RepID=UPI002269DF67|nr:MULTISPECIES: nucleoside permease [unclassified Gilliamella]MCX8641931.1 nucleoside permease [Gilliamella sp. B3835]MCX8706942.1 nucleoside permease [Gilliamella sp. B3783]MCX8708801.1 nucleoside permease [Gilliamella sp. B3780]MCX8710916.1 nucleoside permease [Gilliamella sp. B3468]MCX8713584.1 nucleoside permease [Gilliamella sp. B3781]